ncbi:hypothetical protein DL769_009766 [Monosporascus sp. CRB-8-3]|nr:hypothetical protein DL769_009766 [Monosporascus sp. CRB-8-3]
MFSGSLHPSATCTRHLEPTPHLRRVQRLPFDGSTAGDLIRGRLPSSECQMAQLFKSLVRRPQLYPGAVERYPPLPSLGTEMNSKARVVGPPVQRFPTPGDE